MPMPLQVTLPITSVKTDLCGIRTVTAQIDRRPADGQLQQIKISDPSKMTCRTFVAVEPKATYTTAYYDRFSSNSVVNVSKMTLTLLSVTGALIETQSEINILETSMAPPILIKYVLSSGFSPNPVTQTLYVDVIGRVINSVKVLRTGKVTTTALAELSPEALKVLKEKVATIPVDAQLIDENEGEPRCTDAPSSLISVNVKNKDVAVFQRASCHNFATQEGATTELRDIMMGFLSLTR